jgi:hypothetical protein
MQSGGVDAAAMEAEMEALAGLHVDAGSAELQQAVCGPISDI